MPELKLLKQLQQYKEELSFDYHREQVVGWEREIRGAIVRNDLMKMDGMKELIARIQEKVEKCRFVLMNDRKLDEGERKMIFYQQDIWKWFLSFFTNAKQTVESAKKRLKENK